MAQRAEAKRLSEILDLDYTFIAKFEQSGEVNDLDEVIARLWEASLQTEMNDDAAGVFYHTPSQWHVELAPIVALREDSYGPAEDQDRVINLLTMAVTCSDHPLEADDSCLVHLVLSQCLESRFQREGRQEDLDASFRWRQLAVESHPDDPRSWEASGNLAAAFLERFDVSNDIGDLDNAERYQRKAIHSSQSDLDRTTHLFNLAVVLRRRFKVSRDLQYLDEAITKSREALELCSDHHNPDSLKVSGILAVAFVERFDVSNDIQDLINAERYERQAIHSSQSDPDRATHLFNLGAVLRRRFKVSRDLQHLDEAITTFREASELGPDHIDPLKMSEALAVAYGERSFISNDPQDLDNSERYQRQVIQLRSHPDHAQQLYFHSALLSKKFEASENLQHLDEAITKTREAIEHRLENSLHIDALCTLGVQLSSRFDLSGDVRDLDEAMRKYQEALQLSAQGPERMSILVHLATGLERRFELSGDVRYLDDIMPLRRQYVELCPEGHSDRARALNDLGDSLLLRYRNTTRLPEDIQEALNVHHEALNLCSIGHVQHTRSLVSLGVANFEWLNITNARTPHDEHALTLILSKMINYYNQALEPNAYPLTSSNRALCLYNLAYALDSRFKLFGNPNDLPTSIRMYQEAVKLIPQNHRLAYGMLTGLALAHGTRFGHSHDPNDLDECIRCLKEAQMLVPVDHPSHCKTWTLLSAAYVNKGALQDSFAAVEKAVTHKTATVEERLWVAIGWALEARKQGDKSIIRAYTHALLLLDRFLTSLPTAELQRGLLVGEGESRSIASDACAAAIEAGQLETAIELLEQGRGLLWAKLTRYRHPLDALREVDPTLADEYEAASRELERLATADSGAQSAPSGRPNENASYADWTSFAQGMELPRTILRWSGSKDMSLSADTESDRSILDGQLKALHSASERWDRVVDQIRYIDHFKNFLKMAPFSELQKAAVDGPVIIVNVSKYRSDSLIICDGCSPTLIPLLDAPREKLVELSSRLTENLSKLHGAMLSGRIFGYPWDLLTSLTISGHSGAPNSAEDRIKYARRQIKDVLRSIWDFVVEPITAKLKELECKPQSRVWWYPTGPLCRLPLHAAGPHSAGQDNFCDLYISSYITTLSRNLESRSKVRSAASPSMLVIGEPGEQGQGGFLPSVEEEISTIMKLSSSHMHSLSSLRVLLGEDATPEAVKAHLPKHSWVHFTCHGCQHPQPFSSSFQLHNDTEIRLIDLVQSRLDGAELAFLSACSTATGDVEGAPDEVIHLAAAMEFVGFRSVVGTLWPMRDKDGPDVTREFYAHMLRRGEGADFKDSAEALHRAVKALREAKVPIDCWINFVHFGI